jgi:hydrogenase-1 operon protein HyaF
MSRLGDIDVLVEPVRDEAAGVGGVAPILREIETLLARLDGVGAPGAIDLRGLPLAPGEHDALKAALGEGEVSAAVESLGRSEVRETAVHGVWWVTHRDADGEVVAELIEVATVPEILKTHPADVRAGLAGLRARLAGAGHST